VSFMKEENEFGICTTLYGLGEGEGVVPGGRSLRLWRSGELADPQNASEFNFWISHRE
jgi:hypothetical protein